MTRRILSETTSASDALLDALRSAGRVVVFTGAGISTESGIPDFRSTGGMWSRMEPILYDAFLTSEDARLTDWQRRFDMAERFAAAEPNAAHRVIARLAQEGKVTTVVTQNIDGLHARAGVPRDKLIEIHGAGDHARCLDCGKRHEIAEAKHAIETTGAAPRCADCGGLVKAAIISFGEPMPQDDLEAAMRAAVEADLFLALGTSLVVYPAAALPQLAREAGARLVIASRAPTEQDQDADFVVRTPLAATFAALEQVKI
ncbi:Sir2 family NAD-dependent protein deacetylase [Acuticoccus sp. M5D2P5]|uniref:SIR2 family NAD-dependent protein deacylase n=1 Tax=Acuticoccus kalidii TaxID=2910977 RepID=UPI001F1E398F|nr:Sir2 family NAD-dependent protein deacetylase [Acuticoccus kalidii]MCF3934546.1 Sir2 family NAD-dependent protein deacetylase [Acuticoccus kalidii]